MKKFSVILYVVFLCYTILCGCQKNHTKPQYKAVTQVDIITQYAEKTIHIKYNKPEKIRPVLLYLRLLKPVGKPVQPDAKTDDVYLICVLLSDGTRQYYRQAAHRYFSKGSGPWKAIDPEQATHFYDILRQFSTDV